MFKELLHHIIGTDQITDHEQLYLVTDRVRQIPYGSTGGSRDPQAVIAYGQGTCSGKHELLRQLYLTAGLQVQERIALHRFCGWLEFGVVFPNQITSLQGFNTIIDPHNFLKVRLDDQRVLIDITFDRQLRQYGFPYDAIRHGDSDMQLCVKTQSNIQVQDSLDYKHHFIEQQGGEYQTQRKQLLEHILSWIASIRN